MTIYQLICKVMNISIRKVENGYSVDYWVNSGSPSAVGENKTFVFASADEALAKVKELLG